MKRQFIPPCKKHIALNFTKNVGNVLVGIHTKEKRLQFTPVLVHIVRGFPQSSSFT